MVEHSTADREVPGSNPGAPWSVIRTQAFDDHFRYVLKYQCRNMHQTGSELPDLRGLVDTVMGVADGGRGGGGHGRSRPPHF